jgi:hypothetical protein
MRKRGFVLPDRVDVEQSFVGHGPEGVNDAAPGLLSRRRKHRQERSFDAALATSFGNEPDEDVDVCSRAASVVPACRRHASTRVNVAIQFGSHVLPPSAENACSSRNDDFVIPEKMNRT